MKHEAALKFRSLSMGLALIGLAGCALFSSDEEPAQKNTKIRFEEPKMPYRKIDESTADSVWQSSKTGNTIAVNSSCKKADASLKALEDSILSGVENIKNRSSKKFTLDGSEADRIHAEGETDGIPVAVDLVVVKKADCTYDLAYVGRKSSFDDELSFFDKFLEGFHAP